MYKLRIISENNKFIFNELRANFYAQNQHLTTTRSGASRCLPLYIFIPLSSPSGG